MTGPRWALPDWAQSTLRTMRHDNKVTGAVLSYQVGVIHYVAIPNWHTTQNQTEKDNPLGKLAKIMDKQCVEEETSVDDKHTKRCSSSFIYTRNQAYTN